MTSADRPATRLATRLAFFVAGFGIACWAPLVPFAKARLQIDDAMLGLLLLCIGGGSVAAMLATGPLTARYGSRPVIVASGFLLAAILPFLSIAATPLALGAILLVFGGALGSLDVAVNVHAVEVERASGVPLMSGFHALFSIGGFAGAGLMTLFLSLEVDTLAATLICAAFMLAAMLVARPRLLATRGAEDGPLFVRPQGIVLLLSILAMVTFLAEGAMLDWSALLITQGGLVDVKQGGVGYILFAIAMTAGRLLGDRLVARIGDYRTLLGGGTVAVLGFAVLLAVPVAPVALGGFVLIGLGASNLVPVLFRRAGSQSNMPPALAIGALTTLGYAGILVGPAGIGVVAKAVGLPAAFWILAALLLLVPLTARRVTRDA
ncbi:MAG: MFS transporter [Proteobacteria bacterium]|nr:MFS transporter [Pseudomonadota bacterium]